MATADEYAAWIVKNQSLKGTPDFDTVAKAYQEAKAAEAQIAQPPAPAPEIPGPRQPSLLQRGLDIVAQTPKTAYGLLEVPTTLLTGAVGQLVGIPAGIASTFGEGFGTPQAARAGEERAARIARAMTYQPRTEVGQTLVQTIAKPFENIPPMISGNLGTSAALLAPAAARQAIQTGQKILAPSEAKLAKMAAQDYARGAELDALADAQRLKFVVPPTKIEDTAAARTLTGMAGAKAPARAVETNMARLREVQLADMGLPPTAQLNGKKAFDDARANVAGPYNEVRKLPVQQADANVVAALDDLRDPTKLIGSGEAHAAEINALIDDAIGQTQAGLTGAQLLDNISNLRKKAQISYKNKNITPEQAEIADTRMAIASQLESMIDSNISNPKLLDQWRAARQKMGRIYSYEAATDFNTGVLDVNKIARITSKDSALAGDIAAIGRVAGNLPDIFSVKPRSGWEKTKIYLTRGVPSTAAGAAVGYELGGSVGGAIGAGLGALGGEIGSAGAARYITSPGYQAGLQLRDLRAPVANQLAAQINYGPNQLVPYQPEVVGPAGGESQRLRVIGYDQNGRPIYQAEALRPGFTMPPQPEFGIRPTVMESQRGLPNEVPRQIYEAQKRAELAQGFREAAERKPTSGEVILDINPLTGLPEISKGLRGATPATFQDFGASLKSAADKATAGRMFDMTAAEKVAWNQTKVDLAEVAPGFKALNDKAIAAKMMDREWAAQTAQAAREKAAAFAQIEARAKDAQARAKATANRERMLDLAETLEENLRAPRPDVSGKSQGPKTRAAKRNALAPETNNKLAP